MQIGERGQVNMDWMFPPYVMKETRVRRFGQPEERPRRRSTHGPFEHRKASGTHSWVVIKKNKINESGKRSATRRGTAAPGCGFWPLPIPLNPLEHHQRQPHRIVHAAD